MRGLFGLLFLLRIMLGSFKIARSSFVAELRGPWDEGQKMRIRIVCFVPLTPSSMLLSYSEARIALRATFNLWTWLLATADERRNAVGLVDFFGTKNRRDVSVQKLKRRRKWTMTFQNVEKKSRSSFCAALRDFHSWSSTRSARRSFIHLKIGSFDLRWCGKKISLWGPHYVSWIFGLFYEYKGRRFHAWQLVSEAVKSTRITLGWPIQMSRS